MKAAEDAASCPLFHHMRGLHKTMVALPRRIWSGPPTVIPRCAANRTFPSGSLFPNNRSAAWVVKRQRSLRPSVQAEITSSLLWETALFLSRRFFARQATGTGDDDEVFQKQDDDYGPSVVYPRFTTHFERFPFLPRITLETGQRLGHVHQCSEGRCCLGFR